jgi:hypothetical protein
VLICSSSEWRHQTDFAPDERYEALWETMACAPLRIVGEDVDRVVAQLRRRAKSCGRRYNSVTRQRLPQCEVKATDLMSLLNPAWYHACNRDVADAGVDAAVHFANWGRDEGRLPYSEIDLVRGLGLVDPGTIISRCRMLSPRTPIR